jgi:hypothetical protein
VLPIILVGVICDSLELLRMIIAEEEVLDLPLQVKLLHVTIHAVGKGYAAKLFKNQRRDVVQS